MQDKRLHRSAIVAQPLLRDHPERVSPHEHHVGSATLGGVGYFSLALGLVFFFALGLSWV